MAPSQPNYNIVWADDFEGAKGAGIDTSKWNHKTGANANNEIQEYTTSADNSHLSGDGQVYIVPKKDNNGHWTSARLEGKSHFNCAAGKKMMFRAELQLGTNDPKNGHGIWPAFWTLGANIGTVGWPKCAEWDIMECFNGTPNNLGTLHYQKKDGSHGQFSSKSVPFDNSVYHTYALKVDRSSNNWQTEKLEWWLDGNVFHTVTGAMVGDPEIWGEVAHKSFYPILNVAVGGNPGAVNADTQGGFGAALRVKYVAVYQST